MACGPGIGHMGSDAELVIAADATQIRPASLWLAQAAERFGIPDEALNRLDLCLNEVLANTVTHGRPEAAAAPIHLRLRVQHQDGTGEATVTTSDAGPAFDMTAAAARPRPQTLAEAQPGGLGLVMIRSFADRLAYHHAHGHNHLSFSVRWPTPAAMVP